MEEEDWVAGWKQTDKYEGKGCGQRGRETYPRREEKLG